MLLPLSQLKTAMLIYVRTTMITTIRITRIMLEIHNLTNKTSNTANKHFLNPLHLHYAHVRL